MRYAIVKAPKRPANINSIRTSKLPSCNEPVVFRDRPTVLIADIASNIKSKKFNFGSEISKIKKLRITKSPVIRLTARALKILS